MFFAAKMGSLKMVQLLTARGAQVDIKDKVTWKLLSLTNLVL